MADPTLNVLDGSTFVVGDRRGDLCSDTEREHGFFSDDTRFLSQWSLRVDGKSLDLLGMDQESHFAVALFLTPRVGPEDQAPCSVMRRRCIDRVWIEEITIVNHRPAASDMCVELDVDTDFADLFEVKDGAVAHRHVTWHEDGASLVLEYERGAFRRSVTITSDQPAEISRRGFTFRSRLSVAGNGRRRYASPLARLNTGRRSPAAPCTGAWTTSSERRRWSSSSGLRVPRRWTPRTRKSRAPIAPA